MNDDKEDFKAMMKDVFDKQEAIEEAARCFLKINQITREESKYYSFYETLSLNTKDMLIRDLTDDVKKLKRDFDFTSAEMMNVVERWEDEKRLEDDYGDLPF